MITAEELVKSTTIKEPESNFKMALVVELFENDTAKLQFDGEEVPSEKQYAYLDWYIPQINDRVMIGKIGGTYVVLGKVNYNVGPSIEEEIDRYLFDLKKVIMMQGLSVSGDTELGSVTVTSVITNQITSTQSSLGNASAESLSVSGTASAENISANETVSAGKVNVTGEVSGLKGNFTNGVYQGSTGWSELYGLRIRANLQHNGAYLGFFGKSVVPKTTLNPFTNQSNFSLQDAYSGINNIINALKSYGLF